jgi:hypothetical protein
VTADTTLTRVAPPPRIGRLDTLKSVRLEVVRLYRECRRGDLPASEATKLCYLLKTTAELLIQGDVEDRLAALERSLEAQQKLPHTQNGGTRYGID